MIINPQRIADDSIVKMTAGSRIQQSGIDITIKKLKRIVSATSTDIIYEEVVLPNILQPGVYDFEAHEYVNVPKNMVALIMTRSTWNRRGAYVTCGLYDNSFKNFIGAVLHVKIPLALSKDERIAQIVFFQTEHEAEYQGQYLDRSK